MLVTYRRGEQLKDYFDALARQTRPLDSLVVVDNDIEQSARSIVDRHGLPSTTVEYVVSGDNIGPAGGIALGMRHVLEIAADETGSSRSTTTIRRTPELIETLERFADDLRRGDPHVGGVGLCGGRFDASRGRFLTVGDDELVGPVRSSWVGGDQFPATASWRCEAVGVFDERYFIDFEELDYGLRMQDHGFDLRPRGPVAS